MPSRPSPLLRARNVVATLAISAPTLVDGVPVVHHALGADIRMVAGNELGGLAVLGRALGDAGFVPVDRRDRRSPAGTDLRRAIARRLGAA